MTIMNPEWHQTEIKPRICKTSEHYFLNSHLKVLVKLPLKIEKWGSCYVGSRDYDDIKNRNSKMESLNSNGDNVIKIKFTYHQ